MSSGGEDYRKAILRQDRENKQKQMHQYQEKRLQQKLTASDKAIIGYGVLGGVTGALVGAMRGGFGGNEL